jgi:hypothetical protein
MDYKFNNLFLTTLVIALILLAGCSKSSTKSEPENNAPVISSVTVSPSTVPVSGLTTVTATATDAENDELIYIFNPDAGEILGTKASKLWIAPNTVGDYSVDIRVSDTEGGISTSSGILKVTEAVTQITGIVHFQDGVIGNLDNAVVKVYTDISHWYQQARGDTTVTVSRAGDVMFFAITGINSINTYWLSVWKDNDNNQRLSVGDYFNEDYLVLAGHIPSPFYISEGQTMLHDITMYILTE